VLIARQFMPIQAKVLYEKAVYLCAILSLNASKKGDYRRI